jgi:hydrogenase nickel incorporation protein HypA/HybF
VHELSLCNAIHGIVSRSAAGRPVRTVHLRVGQLRQVVPQTLTYCWDLVSEGGPLGGSALAVESIPVTVECRQCSATTTVEHQLVLVCGACASGDVRVVTGEEFLITHLDLVPQES